MFFEVPLTSVTTVDHRLLIDLGRVVGAEWHRSYDHPDGGPAMLSLSLAGVAEPITLSGTTAAVVWAELGAIAARQREQQTEANERETKRSQALTWLDERLVAGPVARDELIREARDAGIPRSFLEAARSELGIPSFRRGSQQLWGFDDRPSE